MNQVKAPMHKVAVVIGGDLLRVPAAYPLLNFLKESDIPIDLMVGSAGGSLLSALWGLGHQDRGDLEKTFVDLLKLRRDSPVNLRTFWEVLKEPKEYKPNSSFLKEDALMAYLKQITGDATFDDLSYKAKMAATDIYTAETVMLDEGALSDAVYASGALFPMHPAIKLGDHWLASGSYSCRLPLLRTIEEDPMMIIALTIDAKMTKKPKKFMPYASQFISRCMSYHQGDKKQMAVFLYKGEVTFIYVTLDLELDFSDYDSIPEIIDAGARALEVHKSNIIDNYSAILK